MSVAALAAIALAGCGGNRVGAAGKDSASKNPPAQPYSKRSTVPDVVRRVTPADYEGPIAAYRRYVRARLGRLGGQVAALRGLRGRSSSKVGTRRGS